MLNVSVILWAKLPCIVGVSLKSKFSVSVSKNWASIVGASAGSKFSVIAKLNILMMLVKSARDISSTGFATKLASMDIASPIVRSSVTL